MNPDLLKLKHLKDKIIGAEMQLDLIEFDLLAVERDIEFLENMLYALLENMMILKTNGIIAIASEYKKISQELKSVRDNITFYNKMHLKLLAELDKYKKIKSDSMRKHDILQKTIDNKQTVLPFDLTKRKK